MGYSDINISELNTILYNDSMNKFHNGIYSGKIGISIYFFNMYRIHRSEIYFNYANDILESLINNISANTSARFNDGLSGISLGINYLHKNRFIKGNINEITKELDNVIYKELSSYEIGDIYNSKELLLLLYYLYKRIIDANRNQLYIYNNLIINIVNVLYNSIDCSFFYEPNIFLIDEYNLGLFIYVVSKILSLNIYNTKIFRLINKHEHIITSQIPILNSFKLIKTSCLLELNRYYKSKQWNMHFYLLFKQINIKDILEKEMQEKNIFFHNGLPILYLATKNINMHIKNSISISSKLYENMIKESHAWDLIITDNNYRYMHSGLFNGYPGSRLFLDLISRNII